MELKMYTSYQEDNEKDKESRKAVLYSAVCGGVTLENAQIYQKEEFSLTNPPKNSIDSKFEYSLDGFDKWLDLY